MRKTAEGWAVSDLGSGNGTMLNGEAIADETPLNDGDVITLGDTELCYAGASAGAGEATAENPASSGSRRPPVRTARTGGGAIERSTGRGRPVRTSRMSEDPEEAKKKRRKIFLGLGGSLVVIMALLVGWKAIDNKRAIARRIASQQAGEHQGAMADLFKEAKTLVRQGKWAEAKAKLEEIQAEDAEYETRQVENYIKIANTEIPNQGLLAEGNAAIAKGELGKAAAALAKVKTTTQEAALRASKDALDARATDKMGEARALLVPPFPNDLAKMEELKALCEDILLVRVDDREASELRKSAESAIYRIKNPTVAQAPPDTPWLEVSSRFKNGDSSGALSLAQACANKFAQCRTFEANIKEFEAKSKKLEELNEADLIALYDLDKKIAGGTSSELSKPVRTQLVSKLFVKASQAKTTGNWPRAIELARKVQQADPGHVGAQALINEGRTQAREAYLRGYQLRETSPEEAIKLFKDVMSMTPPDDETHLKAKSRVQELQRQ